MDQGRGWGKGLVPLGRPGQGSSAWVPGPDLLRGSSGLVPHPPGYTPFLAGVSWPGLVGSVESITKRSKSEPKYIGGFTVHSPQVSCEPGIPVRGVA